jgi:hypothetical protein
MRYLKLEIELTNVGQFFFALQCSQRATGQPASLEHDVGSVDEGGDRE